MILIFQNDHFAAFANSMCGFRVGLPDCDHFIEPNKYFRVFLAPRKIFGGFWMNVLHVSFLVARKAKTVVMTIIENQRKTDQGLTFAGGHVFQHPFHQSFQCLGGSRSGGRPTGKGVWISVFLRQHHYISVLVRCQYDDENF